jgi:hypothetical protein
MPRGAARRETRLEMTRGRSVSNDPGNQRGLQTRATGPLGTRAIAKPRAKPLADAS